jgi:hypothetical protein
MDLREQIAREIAVYLTKRRDLLDVVLAGNAELGRVMMNDLSNRILAIPEIAEALALHGLYGNGELAKIVFPEGMGEMRNRDCFDMLIGRVRESVSTNRRTPV